MNNNGRAITNASFRRKILDIIDKLKNQNKTAMNPRVDDFEQLNVDVFEAGMAALVQAISSGGGGGEYNVEIIEATYDSETEALTTSLSSGEILDYIDSGKTCIMVWEQSIDNIAIYHAGLVILAGNIEEPQIFVDGILLASNGEFPRKCTFDMRAESLDDPFVYDAVFPLRAEEIGFDHGSYFEASNVDEALMELYNKDHVVLVYAHADLSDIGNGNVTFTLKDKPQTDATAQNVTASNIEYYYSTGRVITILSTLDLPTAAGGTQYLQIHAGQLLYANDAYHLCCSTAVYGGNAPIQIDFSAIQQGAFTATLSFGG